MTNRTCALLACLLWGASIAGVAGMVITHPERHTVLPAYLEAAEGFWHGEDLYGPGIHGFLYLPANAWAMTPFTWLPRIPAEVLWRFLGMTVFLFGILRLARFHAPGVPGKAFLLATCFVLPALSSAARNGQANLLLAALLVHAALDVARDRTARATLLLVLAMAVKPIAIVPLLLLAALDARLRLPLLGGLVLLFALPFAHPDPSYVLAQHEHAWAMLQRAGQPGSPYTELFGGLQHLGVDVALHARTAVRVFAALFTLGLAWRVWRTRGRAVGAVTALALAVTYLMLFNPRTEANAYVLLGAVAAPAAAGAWCAGRRIEGVLAGTGCLLLGTHLLGGRVHQGTKRWLKPLLALLFGAWVLLRTPQDPTSQKRAPGPTQAA